MWRTKFVRLPHGGFAPCDEGAHAECRGLVGDELLSNAGSGDRARNKKKIRDLPERYPLPFTIG